MRRRIDMRFISKVGLGCLLAGFLLVAQAQRHVGDTVRRPCDLNCQQSVVNAAGEDGLRALAAKLKFDQYGRLIDPENVLPRMLEMSKGQPLELSVENPHGLSRANLDAQVNSLRTALTKAGFKKKLVKVHPAVVVR